VIATVNDGEPTQSILVIGEETTPDIEKRMRTEIMERNGANIVTTGGEGEVNLEAEAEVENEGKRG
jgi:hypothetical protein